MDAARNKCNDTYCKDIQISDDILYPGYLPLNSEPLDIDADIKNSSSYSNKINLSCESQNSLTSNYLEESEDLISRSSRSEMDADVDFKMSSVNVEITDYVITSSDSVETRKTSRINKSTNIPSIIREVRYTRDAENDSREESYHKCKGMSCWPDFGRRRLILDTPFSTKSTISYGLIVYAKDTQRWAIIQRKHSVEFLLYMRGLYRLTYLPLLLYCITDTEASIIQRCLKGGPSVFTQVYLKELELCSDGLNYASIRMAESRSVVLNLLSKLDLSKNNLSWTWPKGRLHISSDRETPFECAKREFIEEVEIDLPPPLFISDTYVSESVKTITGRTIESRYWIYIIENEIPMNPPKSHPEVSTRSWVDTETCRTIITNTGISHHDLFKQIVKIVACIHDPL